MHAFVTTLLFCLSLVLAVIVYQENVQLARDESQLKQLSERVGTLESHASDVLAFSSDMKNLDVKLDALTGILTPQQATQVVPPDQQPTAPTPEQPQIPVQ